MNKQVWIEKALGLGIQEFEIYQSTTVEKEMTWFQGQMDTLVSSKVTGTSIRGIVDGKMANMALEEIDDSMCETVLKSLIEQAHIISNEETDSLRKPEPIEYVKKDVTWNMASTEYVKNILQSLDRDREHLTFNQRVGRSNRPRVTTYICRCSSMVELQPSKLTT